MKKIYTLLALALISGSVAAQTKTEGVTYGVRAGVNLATVAISGDGVTDELKDGFKNLTSFYFGGNANIPVSGKISVQPGLALSGKGAKIDYPQFAIKSEGNLMYLEIPVNAVFKFDGFYFGAGPYLGYALAGKIKTTSPAGTTNEDVKFGSNPGEQNRLDYGINGLLGYQLDNGLNFGLNYGLGLGNNENAPSGFNYKESNRVLSFLVGFCF